MVRNPKNMRALALRLLVGLALLGCAMVASAQGTWSVIALPHKSGQVFANAAMASRQIKEHCWVGRAAGRQPGVGGMQAGHVPTSRRAPEPPSVTERADGATVPGPQLPRP